MEDDILKLLKQIKKNVDEMELFNPQKLVENAELKSKASILLILAIDKMESKK